MKIPNIVRNTRDSLLSTATSQTVCCIGLSLAATQIARSQAVWEGTTDQNWNEPTNWNGGVVPDGENAIINATPANIATISGDIAGTPVDIFVGNGDGTSGRLDHTAGTAQTGEGNWLNIPRDGGTGVYNLADTSGTGGEFTGFATGSGSMVVGGQLRLGGPDVAGGNGTVNVNTTGVLDIGGGLQVGINENTGLLNVDSGTITTGDWAETGNGAGSTGTVNLSGGSITKNGGGNFAVGTNGGTGTFNQTGGDIAVNSGEFWVGNGADSQGTYDFSGGTISVDNWIPVGRDSGTGIFTMSGGTLTKTGGGSFTIGTLGTNSDGTVTVSGGLLDIQSGDLIVGEGGTTSTAQFTLSDSGEVNAPLLEVARGAGATGTATLAGGTLTTGRIFGGAGLSDVFFNGTQIIATTDQPEFISGLTTATIEAGGLLVDTNGFNLTAATQELGGPGGVVKSGPGTLNLTSDGNTFEGPVAVNEGTLGLGAGFSGTGFYGDTTVADGAGLGVTVNFTDDVAVLSSATFGSSGGTSLNINLGNTETPFDAPLDVTNDLALNGEVTVNLSHEFPEIGSYPLITYGTQSGTGNFTLGNLPQGVNATLTDDGAGEITLEITQIDRLVWDGSVDGMWDFSTENWVLFGTTNSTAYSDGLPVIFDDDLDPAGTSDIVLNETVAPSGVAFDNVAVEYTLTGSGSISGSGGLTKSDIGTVTLGTVNDYTGPTTFEGGTVSIDQLTDAGVAGPVGAATADPANLNFTGGTLALTGAAGSSDRGLSITGEGGGLSLANDLTLSGVIQSEGGNFFKGGPGNLILTGTEPNVIGEGTDTGFRVNGGTLDLQPGTDTTVNGQLVFSDEDGAVSGLTITDANLTTTGAFLSGGELPPGGAIAGGAGSDFSMEINGTASVTAVDRLQISLGETSTANVSINDSGSLSVNAGWLSIGNSGGGNATFDVNDSGSLTVGNLDFNIGDFDRAQGTLNVNDSAEVVSDGILFVGKGGDTSGTLNLNGGSVTVNNWLPIGRFEGAQGVVNATGGTLLHTAEFIWVGEEGDGTLNISGTAEVVSEGAQIRITNAGFANASGTVNLGDGTPGGTLTANAVVEANGVDAGGTSSFNFNGGTLVAGADASAAFMTAIDTVTVLAGGAIIDTNGNDITIDVDLLDGGGGLTKIGGGTLTLSGQNTYTGTTTVSTGILSMPNAVLEDNSALVLESGTTINLSHGEVDVIGSLTIDGNVLPDGTYDSTTHPGFIIGTGQLSVGGPSGTPFELWAADNGLTAGVNDGPEQDPDNDGVPNLLEFVLGGNPLATDSSILPAIGLDESTVTFTFERNDDSEADTDLIVQYGTDLASWNDVAIGAEDSGPDGNGVTVTVAENAADPDLITVSVPRTFAVDGNLFLRLQANQP